MPDQESNLDFPLNGVHVSNEFGQQPELTCADALNVRPEDAIAKRARGGSRPGHSRYIDQVVPGWTDGNGIQHLNVLVDPTTDALRQTFETPGDDWPENPRIPGTFYPPRGGADQPNPNATQPTAGAITFYQSYQASQANLSAEQTYNFEFNFDLEVVIGHTIVVAILMQENTPASVPGVTNTVTNDGGDPYTRIGSGGANSGYERFDSDSGNETTLSLWYKKVETESDKTIKINASAAGCFFRFAMAEYAGVATTAPIEWSFNSTEVATSSLTTGQFTLGSAAQMAIGWFVTDEETTAGGTTFTADTGYALRETSTTAVGIAYVDDVDHGQDINMEVIGTTSANVRYAAIGVGFFAA